MYHILMEYWNNTQTTTKSWPGLVTRISTNPERNIILFLYQCSLSSLMIDINQKINVTTHYVCVE